MAGLEEEVVVVLNLEELKVLLEMVVVVHRQMVALVKMVQQILVEVVVQALMLQNMQVVQEALVL